MLSNNMLDTLANSGAEIDDTPMILLAQEMARRVERMVNERKSRAAKSARPQCSTRVPPAARLQSAAI